MVEVRPAIEVDCCIACRALCVRRADFVRTGAGTASLENSPLHIGPNEYVSPHLVNGKR